MKRLAARRKSSKDDLPALVQRDPGLAPFAAVIAQRMQRTRKTSAELTGQAQSLMDFAAGHEYFGLHRKPEQWVFREWAPNATAMWLVGTFNDWQKQPAFQLTRISDSGVWEACMPLTSLAHGDLYKLLVEWNGGSGERIPAYARRTVQDPDTKLFAAQVWSPPEPYQWQTVGWQRRPDPPLIYEAHVGMAQEEPKIGTYREFRTTILPRIVDAGYNTLQLMAVQEHPYYGSFGYHVSSFFAASSRFGTPEELKELIDAAHAAGLAVIMDLVHSHAARNENEGLSCFDGSEYQYFHQGRRGYHTAWDSRCFNYGKPEVLHFLLSNCRFWLDEYRFDGFRFDGVTSMLYLDHGLGRIFTSYSDYFGADVDEEARVYLTLANEVIHGVRPDALTVAEDVSGMPGVAAPAADGGLGFDYRLSMGTPDYWIKIIKEIPDEHWRVSNIFYELTNRRHDEKTIGYAESHDQALVGDQTIIFRLIGGRMYEHMNVFEKDPAVDRGIALHKLIRLITLATAGNGYLNFMGNEFGHPEWIDFPREGNQWSLNYARRQWHLRDDSNLRYRFLAEFDRAMLALAQQHDLLGDPHLSLRYEHCQHQLLCFMRAGLLFLFNFSPSLSHSDYRLPAPPGKYELVLDSDHAAFGGYARLDERQTYFTQTAATGSFKGDCLSVYLPTRTALVLRKVD